MSQVFILLHLFICDAYTFFGCFPFLKHLYQINTMAFFFRGPPHHLSLPPILSLAQSRRHFLLIERVPHFAYSQSVQWQQWCNCRKKTHWPMWQYTKNKQSPTTPSNIFTFNAIHHCTFLWLSDIVSIVEVYSDIDIKRPKWTHFDLWPEMIFSPYTYCMCCNKSMGSATIWQIRKTPHT